GTRRPPPPVREPDRYQPAPGEPRVRSRNRRPPAGAPGISGADGLAACDRREGPHGRFPERHDDQPRRPPQALVPRVLPTRSAVRPAGPLPRSDLVDRYVGVVRSCARLVKDWREPLRPIVYQATLSNFDHRRPVHAGERIATGKGPTDAVAERGAIVEA